VLALHIDLALAGQGSGAPRAGQRRQLGAGVDAHRRPRGANVGETLQGRLAGQLVLPRRPGLLQLAARRVVPLAGIGQRLPRRRVVAVQVHHLTAESLVPALRVSPSIVQVPLLPRDRTTTPRDDQADHNQDH
jgi:hypothetical protein